MAQVRMILIWGARAQRRPPDCQYVYVPIDMAFFNGQAPPPVELGRFFLLCQ